MTLPSTPRSDRDREGFILQYSPFSHRQEVLVGIGRILALHHRASTSYQIH